MLRIIRPDSLVQRRQLALVVLLSLLFLPAAPARAQEAADYFRTNCMSCHTIGGGRLTGPDLKDVIARKDREWLSTFMADPRAKLDAGDAYAVELQKEARGAVMPTLPTMTKARALSLLDLIDAESKVAKSQFAGVRVSDRPFTPADVQRGRDICTGAVKLINGGPPCISCHSVNGLGGLGGGMLAPDLTTVFERYEGRKTLTSWLSAPATPTMQNTFKTKALDPDEILPIVAFFQSTLQRSPEDPSAARLNFLLLGLGGTIIALGLFDLGWSKRFTAVRRPLVASSTNKNKTNG
jgi:mono/diheme cytochrome c family protein